MEELQERKILRILKTEVWMKEHNLRGFREK